MKKQKIGSIIVYVILIIILLCYLSPLILVIFGSFKSYSEIMTNVLSIPKKITFGNFSNVFSSMDYPRSFLNTLIATAIGVTGVVIFGSLAGYKLSRVKTKYSSILFMLCIMPMIIPFQSFMITLVKVSKTLGLVGNLYGLGIIYWGLGTPLSIFLYHGFVKSIP